MLDVLGLLTMNKDKLTVVKPFICTAP